MLTRPVGRLCGLGVEHRSSAFFVDPNLGLSCGKLHRVRPLWVLRMGAAVNPRRQHGTRCNQPSTLQGGIVHTRTANENLYMKIALAVALAASCFTVASRASSPPSVTSKLMACSKLHAPGKRLECYDKQIAALKRSAPRTAQTVEAVGAGRASQPRRTATAKVVRRPAQSSEPQQSVAQFGAELLPSGERPPTARRRMALRSTITAKRQVGPGVYFISLANGQVWRQNASRVLIFFHVGDRINIERAALGSYHMWDVAVGSKNWVRVTRVR